MKKDINIQVTFKTKSVVYAMFSNTKNDVQDGIH